MSAEDCAIKVSGISKFYEVYKKPAQRLLQMIFRGRRQFYEPFWALQDVSFEVKKGECLGIIGRNGAGKSTILQIISGTLAPSSGEVKIQGRVAALLELGSGFNPEFTGRENVRLNAAILGLTEKEIDERFDSIVAFSEIGEFIDQPIKNYSSGMVLRLAFAVVAHVDADILIIDEALAVGDAFFTQKCMRFLRDFIEKHTVIFVSHDIGSIMSLCDRAILLDKGQLLMDSKPVDVARFYMRELYARTQGNVDGEHRDKSVTDADDIPRIGDFRDMRQDMLNNSTLRNDIEIFSFDSASKSFGDGQATIEAAWLTDDLDRPLNWVVGGEICRLHVKCVASNLIFKPIVGFHARNDKGQEIFGDNTFIALQGQDLEFGHDSALSVTFRFRMPILPPGDYFISIAIASGTQKEHVQHHWMHEAIAFKSHSSSVASGMVGIPMLGIDAQVVDKKGAAKDMRP